MIKSIIVAKTLNHVIGQDNQLPWYLPKDLQYFRHITMGHHMIMGRKTFTSIKKSLPGRKLIIVTRNASYQADGCDIAQNTTMALAIAQQAGETEVFIAGGATIYRATLALADKIYLTEIKTQLEGDTFFPIISTQAWEEVKRTHHPMDARHPYSYDFVELVRKNIHNRY